MGKTIYEEGMEEQARYALIQMGRKKFGEPAPDILLELKKIDDLDRYNRMNLRILDVTSWGELMETA